MGVRELRELADALDKAEAVDSASWSTSDWYRAQAARIAFIAAARTAVPALLDLIETLRDALNKVHRECPQLLGYPCGACDALAAAESFGVPEEPPT